jgi:AcrR family transcriptional regulator
MLESAALDLVRENGILAGLNLREVADRIGVNRGLVYHYFGSRRDLLRSALRRRGGQLASRLTQGREGRRFRERLLADFREVAATPEGYRLITLLVLDGDPRVRTVPMRDQSLGLLRADVERGDLPEDTDIEALWITLVSLISAYSLFRERFASEFAIPAGELDDRVAAVLDQFAGCVSRSG